MSMSNKSGMVGKGPAFSKEVEQVAKLLGVELDYVDGRQQFRHATSDTLFPVLQALDPLLHAESDFQRESSRLVREQWVQFIEPVLLYFPQSRKPFMVSINLPIHGGALEAALLKFKIIDEKGRARSFLWKAGSCAIREKVVLEGQVYIRLEVHVPFKPVMGYHNMYVQAQLPDVLLDGASLVVSAPTRCYGLTSSRKRWGIGMQLYGVRSKANWGVGDFGDLGKIIQVAGKTWKADTIGLQPLHASTPGLVSPYSPSSRLFWNPLYLDLTKVEEWKFSAACARLSQSRKFQEVLQGLRESPLVAYEKVWQQKSVILKSLYRLFRRKHLKPMTSRGRAFSRFTSKGGEALSRFCIFQALHEYFKGKIWREWPQGFQHPEAQAVQDFKKRYAVRVEFFIYVQWLCELQLKQLGRNTQQAGMSLGLYYDLPVGIHPDGADAWAFQDQLAQGISVGAPPDSFNLLGQSWGLLSPSPRLLRQHGYRFWRETLRRNMQHAGVLRIDHALGLFRMFWVPEGKTGKDGVYVRTYVDEILAVLALESVRNKVVVVGEDLGTVTPMIREKLEKAGLLSYRLLFFERQADGAFQPPEHYPAQALVAATTHDLPTLCGYWAGRDMEVKGQANLYPHPEDLERDGLDREQDRNRLWEALREQGLVSGPPPERLSRQEIQAMYQYLAGTPSQLLMVQLEDILAELETPNLPGATDSAYPSWRIKLTQPLDVWLRSPDVLRLALAIRRARR